MSPLQCDRRIRKCVLGFPWSAYTWHAGITLGCCISGGVLRSLSFQCRGNPMSCLYPNARVFASRMLVILQHFRFRILPSGRMVHRNDCRMCFTSSGVWSGRFGTALICLISCSNVISSSCSRRRRRGLLGITLPSCMIQKGASRGGGIWVVHCVADGSLWAEVARRSAFSFPASPEWPRTHRVITEYSEESFLRHSMSGSDAHQLR